MWLYVDVCSCWCCGSLLLLLGICPVSLEILAIFHGISHTSIGTFISTLFLTVYFGIATFAWHFCVNRDKLNFRTNPNIEVMYTVLFLLVFSAARSSFSAFSITIMFAYLKAEKEEKNGKNCKNMWKWKSNCVCSGRTKSTKELMCALSSEWHACQIFARNKGTLEWSKHELCMSSAYGWHAPIYRSYHFYTRNVELCAVQLGDDKICTFILWTIEHQTCVNCI